jgi:hypothetical protein
MAKAAGGTNQRLKPEPAMVRSLSSNPGVFVLIVRYAFFATCSAHETVGVVNKIPIYASFHAIYEYIYVRTNLGNHLRKTALL